MIRYLPGIVLAVVGIGAYVIGCLLYLAYRRERAAKKKTLMVYALAMMGLGILALGAGLYALELNQIHGLGG